MATNDIRTRLIVDIQQTVAAIQKIEGLTKRQQQQQIRDTVKTLQLAERAAIKAGEKSAMAYSDGFAHAMSTAGGVVIADAAQAAFGALRDAIAEVPETRLELERLGESLNLSRDFLGAFGAAAEQNGRDVLDLADSFEDFSEAVVDFARDGSGKGADAFAELGIQVADAQGNIRDTESVLVDTLGAIQQLGNETEKTAALTALFSDKGAQLKPILDDLPLDDLAAKAREFSVALDEDAIRSAETYRKTMLGLQTATRLVASAVFDAATSLIDWSDTTRGAIYTASLLSSVIEKTAEVFGAFGSAVYRALAGDLQSAIASIADTARAVESLDGFMESAESEARALALGFDGVGESSARAADGQRQIERATEDTTDAIEAQRKALRELRKAQEGNTEAGVEGAKRVAVAVSDMFASNDEKRQADTDAMAAQLEAQREQVQAALSQGLAYTQQVIGAIEQVQSAAHDRRMDDIRTEIEANQDRLTQLEAEERATLQAIATADNDAERQKLEGRLEAIEELRREERLTRELLRIEQRNAFKRDKAAQVALALAYGSVAVLQGFAAGGPVGAAIAGALVATQVGIVAAQKNPYHTGLAPDFSRGPDEVDARLTRQEAVLNAGATLELGTDTIRQLNAGRSMPMGGPTLVQLDGRTLASAMRKVMGSGPVMDRTTGIGLAPVYGVR